MTDDTINDNVTLANHWADLKDYGINPLTGEACAYSLRILCDVSQKGADLLTLFFGGNIQFTDKSNWNSKVGEDDAVASITLPRGILDDLRVFILLYVHNCKYVYLYTRDTVTGTNTDYPVSEGVHRYVNLAMKDGSVSIGGRNVHQATGRVE